ncbi:hypothetical protein CHS0354_037583 [Potamilus streckersoni]|uniref:Uncharacterized protein n=1 Tax=Potamilus streckersoni TaxID=2493646 RepID=A0AAE0W1I4_9BIVA|nr:hypothetical protein CHS0354_037583 [Potamilus streckersoni]
MDVYVNISYLADALRVNDTSVHEQLEAISRGTTGQEKLNYLPPRNNGRLDDNETTDKSRQLKENYNVKVAILIDSGVWDLYYSRISCVQPTRKIDEAKRKIREAYLHIMNGVNLRYKSIDDPYLSITIIPQRFIFFPSNGQFPHNRSKVIRDKENSYIEAKPYLEDLRDWDHVNGVKILPQFDIAMLFTA